MFVGFVYGGLFIFFLFQDVVKGDSPSPSLFRSEQLLFLSSYSKGVVGQAFSGGFPYPNEGVFLIDLFRFSGRDYVRFFLWFFWYLQVGNGVCVTAVSLRFFCVLFSGWVCHLLVRFGVRVLPIFDFSYVGDCFGERIFCPTALFFFYLYGFFFRGYYGVLRFSHVVFGYDFYFSVGVLGEGKHVYYK